MSKVQVFNKSIDVNLKDKLHQLVIDFDSIPGGKGQRNTIKIVSLGDLRINIKAFKVPNLINQVVYNFFRKSKAERSFEYANKLLTLGVGTPKPLAYFEFKTSILFKNSFYISEQLDCDLTYRELIINPEYTDHDAILRAFTRFTYSLHEKGIHFLDHSPGNTLIKKVGNSYEFYLVDLNRMVFGDLDFDTRIKNFARLTPEKSMVEVMSDEYSKCTGHNFDTIFSLMWSYTDRFQNKFQRKKRLKKMLRLNQR